MLSSILYKSILPACRTGQLFALHRFNTLSECASTTQKSLAFFSSHSSSDSLNSPQTRTYIQLEQKHVAHNYAPIPVVITRGKGVFVWDVDNRQYYDFVSAYSCINTGHCPDRLLRVLHDQSSKLILTSRALYTDQLGSFGEYLTTVLNENCGGGGGGSSVSSGASLPYECILPMNTGVEACETALKLARKWAYKVKGIHSGKAAVVVARGNFHGRTLAAVSASDDPSSYSGYEPLLPGFIKIPYNDVFALERVLSSNNNICAFLVEPIQGEAGVIVPQSQYLQKVRAICTKYNVLLICDEVQTGLGRTGKLLASDHSSSSGSSSSSSISSSSSSNSNRDAPQPHQQQHHHHHSSSSTNQSHQYGGVISDILILGKALGGGIFPVSAIVGKSSLLSLFEPGTHGSTWGGNPLACAIAKESVKMILEERLAENAQLRGEEFRRGLQQLVNMYPHILESVRGMGLMNALVVVDSVKQQQLLEMACEQEETDILAQHQKEEGGGGEPNPKRFISPGGIEGEVVGDEQKSIYHPSQTPSGDYASSLRMPSSANTRNRPVLTAWDICLQLRKGGDGEGDGNGKMGLLAKPTHGNIIRFAPPLTITKEQIEECLQIISKTLERLNRQMK